jgi:hypothetical protein
MFFYIGFYVGYFVGWVLPREPQRRMTDWADRRGCRREFYTAFDSGLLSAWYDPQTQR